MPARPRIVAEIVTVIRCEDDDRVLRLPGLLQRAHHVADHGDHAGGHRHGLPLGSIAEKQT